MVEDESNPDTGYHLVETPMYTFVLPDLDLYNPEFRTFIEKDLLETTTMYSLENAGKLSICMIRCLSFKFNMPLSHNRMCELKRHVTVIKSCSKWSDLNQKFDSHNFGEVILPWVRLFPKVFLIITAVHRSNCTLSKSEDQTRQSPF